MLIPGPLTKIWVNPHDSKATESEHARAMKYTWKDLTNIIIKEHFQILCSAFNPSTPVTTISNRPIFKKTT